MGDYNANHGKLFKDVAEVISKRSGYNIHTTSSDDYLNAVLSSIEFIKKCKKDMESIVFRRKTLKNFIKYEDIYVKVIDELNDMYKGLGDVLADFVENGDVDDKEELDKCADKVDEILPKTQLRWWAFK
jgi:Sec7-like guanine-nucleotide exchange factor